MIVPHGPADVIALERGTGVADPGVGRGRVAFFAEDAELVAEERDVIGLSPGCGLVNGEADAVRVPVVEEVALKGGAAGGVGDLLEDLRHGGFAEVGRGHVWTPVTVVFS